jgi:hypothetical protein
MSHGHPDLPTPFVDFRSVVNEKEKEMEMGQNEEVVSHFHQLRNENPRIASQ